MGTVAVLIGQGDSQVLRIFVPPPDELRRRGLTKKEFISLYRDTIAELSDKCGMEIKKEDTWCSSYLFEYSKRYYFKGTEVAGALKPQEWRMRVTVVFRRYPTALQAFHLQD